MTNPAALLLVPTALLFLASCSHGGNPSAEPIIGLEIDGRRVVLTIANDSEDTLRIADYGYRDASRVPGSVFVRVADSSGTVLSNQAHDPQGWWTPRFVDSSVAEPPRTITLPPSSTLERSLSLNELVGAMRLNEQQPVGICRYQVKAIIYYRFGASTRTSSWIEVDCSDVF